MQGEVMELAVEGGCIDCPFFDTYARECRVTGDGVDNYRTFPEECPLKRFVHIEVKMNHE